MNQNESTENVKDSLIITPLIQKTTKMPTKMEKHNKRCCSNAMVKAYPTLFKQPLEPAI
jgi:hypothetical protein